MARPSGSATIEIDSSTPTTGTPMAIANPSPIAGPTDVRPARATASAPRGVTRRSAPPSRKVDTVRAIQSTMRPTAPRSPSAKRSRARSTSPATDERWAITGGSPDTTSPPTDPVSVTTTRPFSAVTSSLTRPLTITSPLNANTQSLHDAAVADAHVAVEDQHPIDRLAAADVDVAGDHDLIVAFGGDGRRERRRRAERHEPDDEQRTQPFW